MRSKEQKKERKRTSLNISMLVDNLIPAYAPQLYVLTVMRVGCVADLHHVVGEQHLMCYRLGHAGAESYEGGGGVFVICP